MTTILEPTGPYVDSAPPQGAGPRARALGARAVLFLIIVAAPTLIAAIYFLLIASPIYVSEARFIVRTAGQPPAAGLGSVLQGMGVGQGTTDAFVVHEYITSRDAVAELDRQGLRKRLHFPGAFTGRSNEHLFKTYKRFVNVSYDATMGVSTLTVEAFAPKDAQEVAETLLLGGERVVNQLNAKAEHDALEQARSEVVQAQERLAASQRALAGFRSRERLIDPARTSTANLELIGRLSQELSALRAERSGLAASAPQSPQLPALDNRIAAYQREIDKEQSKVAGETNSLAPKIGEYERLVLDRDFARQSLAASMSAVETARHEAQRQRLYLQRIVNPSLPDAPMLPRRWRGVAVVFLTALLAYGVLVLTLAGLREHRQ
jgi:BexC/CtrB/KpsE family polysaccharide export inner-membrane protein